MVQPRFYAPLQAQVLAREEPHIPAPLAPLPTLPCVSVKHVCRCRRLHAVHPLATVPILNLTPPKVLPSPTSVAFADASGSRTGALLFPLPPLSPRFSHNAYRPLRSPVSPTSPLQVNTSAATISKQPNHKPSSPSSAALTRALGLPPLTSTGVWVRFRGEFGRALREFRIDVHGRAREFLANAGTTMKWWPTRWWTAACGRGECMRRRTTMQCALVSTNSEASQDTGAASAQALEQIYRAPPPSPFHHRSFHSHPLAHEDRRNRAQAAPHARHLYGATCGVRSARDGRQSGGEAEHGSPRVRRAPTALPSLKRVSLGLTYLKGVLAPLRAERRGRLGREDKDVSGFDCGVPTFIGPIYFVFFFFWGGGRSRGGVEAYSRDARQSFEGDSLAPFSFFEGARVHCFKVERGSTLHSNSTWAAAAGDRIHAPLASRGLAGAAACFYLSFSSFCFGLNSTLFVSGFLFGVVGRYYSDYQRCWAQRGHRWYFYSICIVPGLFDEPHLRSKPPKLKLKSTQTTRGEGGSTHLLFVAMGAERYLASLPSLAPTPNTSPPPPRVMLLRVPQTTWRLRGLTATPTGLLDRKPMLGARHPPPSASIRLFVDRAGGGVRRAGDGDGVGRRRPLRGTISAFAFAREWV